MAEIRTNIHEYSQEENIDQLILDAIKSILEGEPTNLQRANQILDELPKQSQRGQKQP